MISFKFKNWLLASFESKVKEAGCELTTAGTAAMA